ncbi:MAG: class IV adenylate cyclase [Acidobacteriota bacterium]
MSHGGIERELKFADVDAEHVRRRLAEMDAERQGPPAFEDNWIFDTGGELEESGSLLRLRIDRRGARITFKGPASYEGRVKVRQEIETGVERVEAMRSILEALGYRLVRRYQKYREEWLLGSAVVSLDHTPIGDFVELEGEGCERFAERLGLDLESSERRNYLRLYADYLRENPDAPKDMIFPDRTQGDGEGAADRGSAA